MGIRGFLGTEVHSPSGVRTAGGGLGQSPRKPDIQIQSADERIFQALQNIYVNNTLDGLTINVYRFMAPTPRKLLEVLQILKPAVAEVGWARHHPCPSVAMPVKFAAQSYGRCMTKILLLCSEFISRLKDTSNNSALVSYLYRCFC